MAINWQLILKKFNKIRYLTFVNKNKNQNSNKNENCGCSALLQSLPDKNQKKSHPKPRLIGKSSNDAEINNAKKIENFIDIMRICAYKDGVEAMKPRRNKEKNNDIRTIQENPEPI